MKKTLGLTVFFAIVAIFILLKDYSIEPVEIKTNSFPITGNSTLKGNVNLLDGLISPGNSPGKITVTGNFTMGSGATYKCELKDLTGSGSGHDQIDVSGDLTLDGTLDIVLDGYTPNSANEFLIMKFGGTLNGTFSTINWPLAMIAGGWDIDYGVNELNRIIIYGENSVLPFELLDLNVQKQKDKVILNWQTASEKNSAYFDIEHSTEGKDFSKLEDIKAQGSSNSIHDYSFIHDSPSKGTNYYRLKLVDLDRQFSYSKVILVDLGRNEYSFYPNPATKTIKFNQDINSVVIYDIAGKEMLRKENNESILDISELKAGIYIVDFNDGKQREKLIVR